MAHSASLDDVLSTEEAEPGQGLFLRLKQGPLDLVSRYFGGERALMVPTGW